MKERMKRNVLYVGLCLLLLGSLTGRSAEADGTSLIRNHGLPSGSASEALPQGAILYVEFNNIYQTLLNLEQLSRKLLPEKAAPPEIQNLLKTEHPLMTLIGMQTIKEPLTAETIANKLGINPSAPVTLALYLGDPKKSFIISVPLANGKVMGGLLTNVLKPSNCEELSVGGKPAIRLAIKSKEIPELYVVCSEDRAYFCADRSQVLALHNTPAAERLGKSAFMKQATARVGNQDLVLIFNPGLIKPVLLQLQQLGSLAVPLLHAQREKLMNAIPPPARANLQMQVQNNFGVRDLEQFADFTECFVIATYEVLTDTLAKQLIAFEGLCLSVKLDPAFPQLTAYVLSRQFQPDKSADAIPVEEVRKTMTWLGKDFQGFTVSGRQPLKTPSAFSSVWTKKVKSLLNSKGLSSVFIDNLETLLEKQTVSQPLETRAPWVMTTYASLNPLPSPRDYHRLNEYFQAFLANLGSSIQRPITVVAGQSSSLLESYLKDEAQSLNQNDQLARDFNKRIWNQTPFYDRASRLKSESLTNQVKKFIFENAYTTHGGLFGYDQHELINRRTYLAREVDGYLVYHQGSRNATWLSRFPDRSNKALTPALAKLLDRVPTGANYFSIHRTLQRLPELAQWLSDLENLAREDLNEYLARATKIQQEAPSPEEANTRLKNIKMPDLVYSLNREAASGKLYCLLVGNGVFPRDPVMPVVTELLADYAAQADQSGGCLVYTRVQPEAYEFSIVQNTDGIACLVTNVANTLVEHYLSDPAKMQQLQQRLIAKRDSDPERFDEIIVKNARWEFLPGQKQQRPAKPTQAIPARDPQAAANLIDLSAFYNAALTETWHNTGNTTAQNHLGALPRGIQEFGGVKFDVRGLIQLSGRDALSQLVVRFPKEVKNIKVDRLGQSIHFLHAAGWMSPDGTTIGNYVVHYANGETREIPIVYGRDVRDWWTQNNEPAKAELNTVWTGKNSMNPQTSPPQRLFKTTWKNPLPNVKIDSIDYRSTMTATAPFLVAITVE
jgi:hypothetical protein